MLSSASLAAIDQDNPDCFSADGGLDDATPSEVADIFESSQQDHGDAIKMTSRTESAAPFQLLSKQHATGTLTAADEPSDDGAPTLRELAAAEGLYHDYYEAGIWKCVPWPTPPSTSALEDADEWPSLGAKQRQVALDLVQHGEKWDADRESMGFLASTLVLGKEDTFTASITNRYADIRELRADVPILRCDAEMEMRRLRARNHVAISTNGMPPFEMHADQDEDLDWPAHVKLLPQSLNKKASDVKWDVDKATMTYIRDMVDPGCTDFGEVIQTLVEAGKVQVRLMVSPTILPLSPPHEPQPLPADMMTIPFTSSPEDLIAAEAEEIGQEVLARHDETIEPPISCVDPGSSQMDRSIGTPSIHSSIFQYNAGEELYAEVPILPADSSPIETSLMQAESSRLPKAVQDLVPLPQPDIDLSSTDAQAEHNDFIESVLRPMAQAAIQATNNERLVDLDTIMRVPIPAIDPIEPTAPWDEYESDEHHTLLSRMKHDLSSTEMKWDGVKRVEKILNWTIFPMRMAKVDVAEEFDDDGSCDRYLKQLAYDDEVGVEALVAKAECLRILKGHYSDDDEIEVMDSDGEDADGLVGNPNTAPLAVQPPLPPQEPMKPQMANTDEEVSTTPQPGRIDLSSLLRKRKMELEAASSQKPVKQVKSILPQQAGNSGPVSDRMEGLVLDHHHMDGHGIGGFLRLHGIAATPGQPVQAKTTEPERDAPPAPTPSEPKPGAEKPADATYRDYPTPELINPDRAIQIITTTQLLANRKFLRDLQSQLPGLDFIERDNIEDCSGDRKLGHVEADITMSAGTGMIITTLQKLKQKALPGQSTFTGIRERILRVAPRYEKVILLVSEGRQNDVFNASGLDDRDCDALLDLHGFVATFETEVEIFLVPGGERELAGWTAAHISKYGSVGESGPPLLAEETLWERFLRQAGLNAFAAQAVLGLLKQPEQPASSDMTSTSRSTGGEDFGLAAFVQMSEGQRVQRFGGMIGGAGLLRRVSKVIDGSWSLK